MIDISKILENKYLQLSARIIVALVFIVFGMSKIAEPAQFAKDINNYGMLPYQLTNLAAIILPWIELISGLLLLLGVRLKTNALLIAAMLIIFNIAVATAWARGLDIHCGCYSDVAEQTVGWQKLVENFGLLILLLIIYFFKNNALTLEALALKHENS